MCQFEFPVGLPSKGERVPTLNNNAHQLLSEVIVIFGWAENIVSAAIASDIGLPLGVLRVFRLVTQLHQRQPFCVPSAGFPFNPTPPHKKRVWGRPFFPMP